MWHWDSGQSRVAGRLYNRMRMSTPICGPAKPVPHRPMAKLSCSLRLMRPIGPNPVPWTVLLPWIYTGGAAKNTSMSDEFMEL